MDQISPSYTEPYFLRRDLLHNTDFEIIAYCLIVNIFMTPIALFCVSKPHPCGKELGSNIW